MEELVITEWSLLFLTLLVTLARHLEFAENLNPQIHR